MHRPKCRSLLWTSERRRSADFWCARVTRYPVHKALADPQTGLRCAQKKVQEIQPVVGAGPRRRLSCAWLRNPVEGPRRTRGYPGASRQGRCRVQVCRQRRSDSLRGPQRRPGCAGTVVGI